MKGRDWEARKETKYGSMPAGHFSKEIQLALRMTGLGCREGENGNLRWRITGIQIAIQAWALLATASHEEKRKWLATMFL